MAAVTGSIIAGATAVGGVVSGIKSAKKADQALARQQGIDQQQVDLGREQLAWAQDVYNQWRSEFDPILTQLKAEATAGRTPDYAAITSDVTRAFASSKNENKRNLERYGIKPGDGRFGANERTYGISSAASEVQARQNARKQYEDDKFNRLSRVYGIGTNLQTSAMSQVAQGYGILQNTLGNQGNTQGRNAQLYGDAAANGFAAATGQDWQGIIDTAFNSSNAAPEVEPASG